MRKYIGCDAHQKYLVFVAMNEAGEYGKAVRVENRRAELRAFLRRIPAGTPVAVEASGGWYWLIDELEAAGLDARLANPTEAKKRMPGRNKTDERDARGLALLLRNQTLPQVWIPPAPLRDLRGLLRTRLALRNDRTRVKNRMHATIRRYGLRDDSFQDLFAGKARVRLSVYIGSLPEETREAALREWMLVDELSEYLKQLEARLAERLKTEPQWRQLKTLPGVGLILGATLLLEIGDVGRFPTAMHLASYAGLTPVVHASGGRTHLGPTSKRSNHYLRWAFVEAANSVVSHQKQLGEQHVVRLYRRLAPRKGHAKAAVAVGRHLAEASWWMLTKDESYRAPARRVEDLVRDRVSA